MAIALPAFCPTCKTVFPSGFVVQQATNTSFSGNRATCPVCHNPDAKVIDGTFDIASDVIKIISAPEFTVEILKAFAAIAKSLSEGKIPEQQAISEANNLSPKLGQLLRGAANKLTDVALIATLTAVLVAHYDSTTAESSADKRTEMTINAITDLSNRWMPPGPQVERPNQKRPQLEAPKKPAIKDALSPAKAVPKGLRRSQVNHSRREAIKKRRSDFGGSRSR
jgi:hypothetical protein